MAEAIISILYGALFFATIFIILIPIYFLLKRFYDENIDFLYTMLAGTVFIIFGLVVFGVVGFLLRALLNYRG